MNNYNIEIEKKIIKSIKVKANSIEEAITKVKKLYANKEISLDSTSATNISFRKFGYLDIIKSAIKDLVDYNYKDEERNFEESFQEGKENHIFTRIKQLKEFIECL